MSGQIDGGENHVASWDEVVEGCCRQKDVPAKACRFTVGVSGTNGDAQNVLCYEYSVEYSVEYGVRVPRCRLPTCLPTLSSSGSVLRRESLLLVEGIVTDSMREESRIFYNRIHISYFALHHSWTPAPWSTNTT